MTIINLTPHPIVLRTLTGEEHTISPSGGVARVTATPGPLEEVTGLPVPVARPDTYGDVEGLPEATGGVFFIVSAMVGARVARPDVLMPGTGPQDGAIRNDKGHIVAVTRLKATA